MVHTIVVVGNSRWHLAVEHWLMKAGKALQWLKQLRSCRTTSTQPPPGSHLQQSTTQLSAAGAGRMCKQHNSFLGPPPLESSLQYQPGCLPPTRAAVQPNSRTLASVACSWAVTSCASSSRASACKHHIRACSSRNGSIARWQHWTGCLLAELQRRACVSESSRLVALGPRRSPHPTQAALAISRKLGDRSRAELSRHTLRRWTAKNMKQSHLQPAQLLPQALLLATQLAGLLLQQGKQQQCQAVCSFPVAIAFDCILPKHAVHLPAGA